MPYSEIIRQTGRRALPLPYRVLYALNWLLWTLRLCWLSEVPPVFLGFITHRWVADNTKFREVTGIDDLKSSADAVRDYVAGQFGR